MGAVWYRSEEAGRTGLGGCALVKLTPSWIVWAAGLWLLAATCSGELTIRECPAELVTFQHHHTSTGHFISQSGWISTRCSR